MWIIRSVDLFMDGEEHDKQGGYDLGVCVGVPGLEFKLQLYNTDTRETVVERVTSQRGVLYLERKYSPYGLTSHADSYFAVAVDGISLKFLKLVDAVTEVVIPVGCREHDALSKSQHWCESLDTDNSLFASCFVTGMLDKVHTLFYVAGFDCKLTLVGNSLYIRRAEKVRPTKENAQFMLHNMNFPMPVTGDIPAYKVDFVDAQLAKRFLTKAVVSGLHKEPEYKSWL